MSSNIRIVSASPEQSDIVVAIQKTSLQGLLAQSEYEIPDDELRAHMFGSREIDLTRKRMCEKTEQSWFASHPLRNIVGCATALKLENESRISGLYVEPEYQNIGTENRLLGWAFDWIGTKAVVSVEVPTVSAVRIKFYEELGFRRRSECVIATFPDGKQIPGVILVFSA